jgi:hypothetical protein
MSVTYPSLYDVEPEAAPASASSGAPPCENEGALVAMTLRHKQACAMCSVALSESGGRSKTLCNMTCGHTAHMFCAQIVIKTKALDNVDRLGGVSFCNHCRELSIAGLAASAESVHESDPETTHEFCTAQLKRRHAEQYKTGDFDAVVATQQLQLSDIRTMLGETQSAQLMSRIASKVTNNSWTKWLGLEGDEEEVWNAEAPPPPYDYSKVPHGDEFIELMRTKRRTLDDIFETLRYTLAHIFNAGVQTMDQLRALGFAPARHLVPSMRPVMPVHFLVERYGFTYAVDMKTSMTNDELVQCNFSPYELPLIGLSVRELAERRFTAAQMAQMTQMRLGDWIRFAGLQVPHALAMHMTGEAVMRYWTKDLAQVDTPAYAFYVALCAATGEQPQAPPVLRKKKTRK